MSDALDYYHSTPGDCPDCDEPLWHQPMGLNKAPAVVCVDCGFTEWTVVPCGECDKMLQGAAKSA